MVAEAGAEADVEALVGGAVGTMSRDPVKEEGPGEPPEASVSTLIW